MEQVRFAWLTDAHLPLSGFYPLYWNVKRGLGWLNWQMKRRAIHTRQALDLIVADLHAQRPDHILVSGDLINIGLPAEYEAAAAWLQTLGPADRVSVVPGNHDIYVQGASLRRGLGLWRDYALSDTYGRAVNPRSLDTDNYPFVRRIGQTALIGVNSALPTAVGWAKGRVEQGQLDSLQGVLLQTKADGLVRLVMIHHPPLPGQAPPRRALENAGPLADLLAREGAELVIFGHNHTESATTHAGIPIIGGASASAARAHGHEPPARYHLITIGGLAAAPRIEIETRGLDTAGQRIIHIANSELGSDSAPQPQ